MPLRWILADVTGTVRAAPVIFDDPISSLDQDFGEKAAARLVGLSRTRQVIVFTHRLSMMTLLQDGAKKMVELGQPVTVAVQVIARTAEGIGYAFGDRHLFSEAEGWPLLRDWTHTQAGFYLYAPTREQMPAKVRALLNFLVEKRAEIVLA